MKVKKMSPGKLKQLKITLFGSKAPTSNAGNDVSKVNCKKRKIDAEAHEVFGTPKRIATCSNFQSPDLFKTSGENVFEDSLENSFGKDICIKREIDKENLIEDENQANVNDQGSYFGQNTSSLSPGNLSPKKRSSRKPGSSHLQVLENVDFKTLFLPNTHDNNEISFEDFENDPFLSPKKSKSPVKNDFLEKSLENEKWIFEQSEINFEEPVRCKILKSVILTKKPCEQILLVQDEKNKKGLCKLREVWTFSSFSLHDVVVIQSIESEDGWIVNNNVGYIILHPDVIISSTSLVSSMFCMRQGLLSGFFKGVDLENNSKMLIGRLVHELLQVCLKSRKCSDEDFSKIIADLVHSHEYLRDIYFSGMTFRKVEEELEAFVPRIRNFLDVYVNKEISPTGKNFCGSIEDVMDIEELIRSPNLGIQGRIDATVRINSKGSRKVAPLELKTGKASFSYEHRSQLVLYVLLMNELGREVESGLLLYLRENIMEEIMPQREDIRNLFLLRNQLVRFFKAIRTDILPDPIRNVKACGKCSYLRVCTSYLKHNESDIQDMHPLTNIELPDIKPSHVNYFMKWNKMLWLEFGEVFEEKADEYEISELKLSPDIEYSNSDFKCSFFKSGFIEKKKFQPGVFVHVLNGKRNRICSGRIVEITSSGCSVSTDKKLSDFSDTYHIVVYKSTFLSSYMSNLGIFLNEQFESLRELIIDKKLPTFREKIDKESFKEKCLKNLMALNKEQQKAILKTLLCNDYLIIKGPPGTGKTQTIVTLIKILVGLNHNVLVVSHTNSSVDNILMKLNDVEFLRLGSLKSVTEKIHHNCYANIIKKCSNLNDVEKLFNRKVIAATCSGLDTDFVAKKKFDFCIVDESSQVLQPEILKPLFCCKRFILVGDEDQLPPIVQNLEAKNLGMDVSMFEWLTNDCATVHLKYQYRMNSVINALANDIAYYGSIECANKEVAEATLRVLNFGNNFQSNEWVSDVLSNDLEKSVIFVNTSEYFSHKNINLPEEPRSSLLEANIIAILISNLLKLGVNEENIGVIAPFCDQVNLLKKRFEKEKFHGVELNTVDQYQGRDKEVILFSCGKENQSDKIISESELLNDKRRLTVAVTRAKHKLVIVGDKSTVVKYSPFEKLINSLKDSQFVNLMNGEKNFYWERLKN